VIKSAVNPSIWHKLTHWLGHP